MSTIKSSNEHLTLNADGSGKDIKFQSNGSEVASISDGGVVTATSYAGSGASLTGVADGTKLPLAGGALTGNITSNSKLTINNATVQGALVGVYTGGFNDAGVVAESGIHLANSTAANTVMQMTFGLQSPAQTKAAGYIGFKNTDVTGLTKGALIFGTRDVVTDTTPIERLRITSDGRGLSQFTAKAWWRFNGTGTVAIADSHNVSSVSDSGTGDYRINYANSLSSANHSVVFQVQIYTQYGNVSDDVDNQNAGFVDVIHREGSSPNDSARVMGQVFGD